MFGDFKLKFWALIWFCVFALAACVPESGNYEPQQNLSGQRIPFVYEKRSSNYLRLAPNIGMLTVLRRARSNGSVTSATCTGTAIGQGYFITAYHCLSGPVEEASLNANAVTSTSHKIVPIQVTSLRSLLNGYDVGIGRFEGVSSLGRTFEARLPVQGERMFVLHHPNGRLLSVSEGCRVSSQGDAHTFTHTCDTLKGSSGALMFAASDGAVVGVHAGSGTTRELDNYGVHIMPIIAKNQTLASLFRVQEAAPTRPTIEDFQALARATRVIQGPVEALHAFRDGVWTGLGQPPIPEAIEIARKYCSDTIGQNCGRHGDWRVVAPPNHDPRTIGVRVCGTDRRAYQLVVQNENNFTYRLISGEAPNTLRKQTIEFQERLRGFNRTRWGDLLLELLDKESQC